mmetsp:Transcript_24573/g.28315  ORF Transcript_24573/g.28315 Transcript_24573/m.28315 type:complete len:248 (+) Transcript_24573:55-798(+)
MYMPFTLRLVCCLLLLIASDSFGIMESNSIPFTSVERGYYSSLKETLTETCRTREEFEILWKKHENSLENIPTIDFNTNMLLCVFRGSQNTGGYDIHVESVKETDSEIIATCLTSDPPPGAGTTNALTQPHDIVSVPKSDKPVRYIINEAPPPLRPFPTFVLTFDKDVDPSDVIRPIEEHDAVQQVTLLKSVKIAMVNFDREKVSEAEALTILEAIDGVATVEMDPPPDLQNGGGQVEIGAMGDMGF